MDDILSNEVLKSGGRLKQEIKCMKFIDFHRILYTVLIPQYKEIISTHWHVGREPDGGNIRPIKCFFCIEVGNSMKQEMYGVKPYMVA